MKVIGVFMFLQSFYTSGLAINSYLVGDMSSRRAVIIDPTRHVNPYLACAEKEGLTITDIIETHVHADFISGAKELKHRLGKKPTIHCSSMGGKEWTPSYVDKEVKHGDAIRLGVIRLEAMHTPGHTPEHLMWLCYDETRSKQVPCLAFTGDLLFVGSVGRPDLLGKGEIEKLARQLYQSLFVSLAQVPDFLEIYPAHGAGSLCGKGLSARLTSTLGYERLFNPMLIQKSLDQWLEGVLLDMPIAPVHFQRMKKNNVSGTHLLGERSIMDQQQSTIIDVRNPEEFAQGHFKGALNIPFGASFCNWAGSFLDENTPLTLVASTQNQLKETVLNLQLVGFDQIQQTFIWNGKSQEGYPLEVLSTISVEKLAEIIQTQEQSSYLVDVRTGMEWNGGHIAEAHHLELPLVKENTGKLPKESAIYMICGSGYRASLAASLLKKQGFPNVSNIKGGMMAWCKAGLPTLS
jgi:hydroxyacylglutathione hydrolase